MTVRYAGKINLVETLYNEIFRMYLVKKMLRKIVFKNLPHSV